MGGQARTKCIEYSQKSLNATARLLCDQAGSPKGLHNIERLVYLLANRDGGADIKNTWFVLCNKKNYKVM